MSLIKPKFSSLFNTLIKKGKRSLANKISWHTLQNLRAARKIRVKNFVQRRRSKLFSIIERAMNNTRTQLRLRTKKISGRMTPIPAPLSISSQRSTSSRWLLQASHRRRGSGKFSDKLSAEIVDASYNRGTSVRKRRDHDWLVRRSKSNVRYLHKYLTKDTPI